MMIFKKIVSVLLIIGMFFCVCACAGEKPTNKENNAVKSNWYNGEPDAPGDVFELPEIKSSENAPIIAEFTKIFLYRL